MNVNKININQTEPTYDIPSDAYDITYEESNVGEKLSELESKMIEISNEVIETDEESIIIEDNNGNEVGRIDSNGSDFKNLKSNGTAVATIEELEGKQDLIPNLECANTQEQEESLQICEDDGQEIISVKGGVVYVYGQKIPYSCSGYIKPTKTESPVYQKKIGNIDNILNHFKIGMVKDGKLLYFLNQTDITTSENGKFDSILDGNDGDMLIVNDVPIYYLIHTISDVDVKLFSLNQFEFDGVPSEKIESRGDAPSLAYVDNIYEKEMEIDGQIRKGTSYEDLGDGQCHFCRNANNVATIADMQYLQGKYVPYNNSGTVVYKYEQEEKYIKSGKYHPTMVIDLKTAEKSATNKNIKGSVYTNKDLLSREILISLLDAEYGTKDINSLEMFGIPFSSYGEVTEGLFTNGLESVSGCRFKDAEGNWIYSNFDADPFNTGTKLFEMLTNWRSPWEIMEQHLVLSYAKRLGINPNTWFVYNENEYKYKNVGNNNLNNGVMTAVVFKKFRSKLLNVNYNNYSVSGNDIEYVIHSAIYRGWVLDVNPHFWLTGINCVLDGNKEGYYYFYVQRNYKKYITETDYDVISSDEIYDFEKEYVFAGSFRNMYASHVLGTKASDKSVMVPTEVSESKEYRNLYECLCVETDRKKASINGMKVTGASITADANVKNVTGVKTGYGAINKVNTLNNLYLWHPRNYNVAYGGGMSFVCQNVIV